MKSAYQLISQADGRRSPAAVFERGEFAALLKSGDLKGLVGPDDFVLVLMDLIGEEWVASSAAIMRVETFINNYGVQS